MTYRNVNYTRNQKRFSDVLGLSFEVRCGNTLEGQDAGVADGIGNIDFAAVHEVAVCLIIVSKYQRY
jgi:hypothetical protein